MSIFAFENYAQLTKGRQIALLVDNENFKSIEQVQQQRTILGTITDATTGEPLAEVGMSITGTIIGAVTDANGKFTLNVPTQNASLVVSFLGSVKEAIEYRAANNSSFLNGPEAFANFRRSGFPTLTPNPYPGREVEFINRLTYPNSEISVNTENVKAAIASQGPDDLATKVWWDK